MKLNLSLRTKLLWTFGLLTGATVTTLITVSCWFASRAIERQCDASMAQLVTQTVRDLGDWVAEREREAALFGEIEPFKAACQGQQTNEARARLVAYYKRSAGFENLFLADTNGVLFLDSIEGKSIGVDLTKNPASAINAQKAQEGQLWVGEVQKSPATGRPVVLITAPVQQDGRFVGIAGMPIELAAFCDSNVKHIKVGHLGYIGITDSKGTVLAHKDPTRFSGL